MKTKLVIITCALLSIAACKKDANGNMVIQKPVLSTVPDTLHPPVVETHMDSTRVAVPKLEVKHDSATVRVPRITVRKP